MSYPKQIKKTIPLVPEKILSERRRELAEYITKDGTFLPKSVLHADLDKGMLDFVKEELKLVTDGRAVPTLDIILTTQNWSQFAETWNFVDNDYNAKPPFITVVRSPEVKYGTNPSLLYTIPNRKQFYFAAVPTWDGNKKGMDIYTIPQPVPVDINYSVKIICNRMREINQFNKIVLQKFSSRQAYTFIKGQYVPIVSTNISDESSMDIDKRKYYIQTYDFTMLGYLIDEEEFEVKPAISRTFQVLEADTRVKKKKPEVTKQKTNFQIDFNYEVGNDNFAKIIEYTVDIQVLFSNNVSGWDVYINGDFYGSDLLSFPLNTNDTLLVTINRTNPSEVAKISFVAGLV